MKYSYKIVINKEIKSQKHYEYSYGKTKDISISISKDSIIAEFYMSVKKTHDDFKNLKVDVFRDLLRKSYLLHAVIYDSALSIKTISVYINDEKVEFDKKTPMFPFVYSMIEQNQLKLGRIKGDKRIIYTILNNTKTKSNEDMRLCSLYAYMLSQSKKYEVEKFLNLWTSMNAYYNVYAKCFEEIRIKREDFKKKNKNRIYKIENKCLGMMIRLIENNALFPNKPDDKEEYKTAYKMMQYTLPEYVSSNLEQLYNESKENINKSVKASDFIELYKIVEPLNLSLYVFLLIVFPYHIRCNIFHGSNVIPIVASYKDLEISNLRIVNMYLEKFLSDNIPHLFDETIMNENEYLLVKEYLDKVEK